MKTASIRIVFGHSNVDVFVENQGECVAAYRPDDTQMKYLLRTQLNFAASFGYTDLAEVLIENGAEINQFVDGGFYNQTPLFFAARKGHCDVIRLLIANGADPNHKDLGGYTALFFAAAQGYENAVKTLLDGGAEPSLQNELGETPLLLAKKFRHRECEIILSNALNQAKKGEKKEGGE